MKCMMSAATPILSNTNENNNNLNTNNNNSNSSNINSKTPIQQKVVCGACQHQICDRYILKVADTSYHERCLQCTSCSIRLMNSCFTRDAKLYCRFDYER